jgi:hypothetical protein
MMRNDEARVTRVTERLTHQDGAGRPKAKRIRAP